jgi:hypothetical protein
MSTFELIPFALGFGFMIATIWGIYRNTMNIRYELKKHTLLKEKELEIKKSQIESIDRITTMVTRLYGVLRQEKKLE